MVDIIKKQFNSQNNLICNGEYFHVRCNAHVLNLIVQEGLEVIGGALKKIRESIKYVRASEAIKIAFKKCVLQVRGIDTKVGLRMNVACRNLLFDGRAMRDSRVRVTRKEYAWSRHQRLFEENVGKTGKDVIYEL